MAVEDGRCEIWEEDYIEVSSGDPFTDSSPESLGRMEVGDEYCVAPVKSFRRRKGRRPNEDSHPERREFVYLDEVSVLSILASRKGGIATEFTEGQTASLDSEVQGSLGVGLGGTGPNLGSKMQAGQVEASQVSRRPSFRLTSKSFTRSNARRWHCIRPVPTPITCLKSTRSVASKGCLVVRGNWPADRSTYTRSRRTSGS